MGQRAGFARVCALPPGRVRGGAGWGVQGPGRPGKAGAGALPPPPKDFVSAELTRRQEAAGGRPWRVGVTLSAGSSQRCLLALT